MPPLTAQIILPAYIRCQSRRPGDAQAANRRLGRDLSGPRILTFPKRMLTAYLRCRYTNGVANGIEFDWDAANLSHVAEHGVTPEKTQQMFENDPVDLDYQVVESEERWVTLGVTIRGRFLVVVWTIRGSAIRVVTAFDADQRHQRVYLEQRRN